MPNTKEAKHFFLRFQTSAAVNTVTVPKTWSSAPGASAALRGAQLQTSASKNCKTEVTEQLPNFGQQLPPTAQCTQAAPQNLPLVACAPFANCAGKAIGRAGCAGDLRDAARREASEKLLKSSSAAGDQGLFRTTPAR